MAAAADDQVTTDTARIASNRDGDTIEVRPLDDPANPYAGQYGAWDLWIWDNYQSHFNRDDFQFTRDGDKFTFTGPDGRVLPEGWAYDLLEVDAAGFAIPVVTGNTTRRAAIFGTGGTLRDIICNRPVAKPQSERYFIYGAGVKPVGLDEDRQHAYNLALARDFPVIPAWAGEHLPLWLAFSPNGDIVCYGELGLHYRDTGVHQTQLEYLVCPETWYRYSPEGELLGQYTRPPDSQRMAMIASEWTAVYSPDRAERVSQARTEMMADGAPSPVQSSHNGYIALVVMANANTLYTRTPGDMQDAEIAIAWDYLGNEVDPDAPLDLPNTNLGQAYPREWLAPVYAAQVELGLTDPTAASPFAGLENGPRVVDPAPRSPRYLAHAWRRGSSAIEVRPLDDLQNPYRGHYDEWDTWLLDQIGRRNPREDAFDQAQFQKRQAQIEAKVAAGEAVTPADHAYVPYEPGPDDPWKSIEIQVDDHGWVIPARIYAEMLAASRTEPWDVRENRNPPSPTTYTITSGGVMPAEMLAEYTAACEAAFSGLPVVPAWLAAAPVHQVVFVPNGEIVTLGPLGHRTAENRDSGRDEIWREVERAWYRYDAAGNLLDTYATQGEDWQTLYHPRWNALKSNALDSGMEVTEPAGYLVITDPVTGECKAVFDYDGTPVDPNSMLSRPYGYGRSLRWQDLQEFPVADAGDQVEE